MLKSIRDWAESYTREGKYSPIGIGFHWVMAGLVLYQLWLGWTMSRIPVGGDKLAVYERHGEIGLSILLLAILRGAWRLLVQDPVNDAHAPEWERKAAEWTHFAFYGLFVLLPLSGWCMWSAIQPAQPLSLLGLSVPLMPFYDLSPAWQQAVLDWTNWLHGLGVVGLALLVPMHVGAALKHHFWDRDDVVKSILPEIPDYDGQDGGRAPQGPPPHAR